MQINYWKRKPNKHYFIGQKTNGSTITRIFKPDLEEEGAYIDQWHGAKIKKNPRWMNITLASGKTIKSTELVQDLTDLVESAS
jgi:5S rRNA maturation endonuclease (ribonuclease M5)